MDDKKTRGEALRRYIKSRGLTQREAAAKIGISAPHLANLLNGRDSMGHLVVQKIITAFPELNPTYLLTGEGALNCTSNIQHLERVSNSGNIVNGVADAALVAEVQALREQLERERAEKTRLLGIIETITTK